MSLLKCSPSRSSDFLFRVCNLKTLKNGSPSRLIPNIVSCNMTNFFIAFPWQNSTQMCFRKQIFRRFSLGLIFGYSKISTTCCGFMFQIRENLFMYVLSASKQRNYYWILWRRIDAKNPAFVTASPTSFFSIPIFLSSNQTLLNGFEIRVTDSNFISF